MYLRYFLILDIRTPAHKVIYDPAYRALVAWNYLGRENYRIAFLHLDVFVLVHGNARQNAHGLALAAGSYNHYLRVGKVLQVFQPHPSVARHLQIAEIEGYLC